MVRVRCILKPNLNRDKENVLGHQSFESRTMPIESDHTRLFNHIKTAEWIVSEE